MDSGRRQTSKRPTTEPSGPVPTGLPTPVPGPASRRHQPPALRRRRRRSRAGPRAGGSHVPGGGGAASGDPGSGEAGAAGSASPARAAGSQLRVDEGARHGTAGATQRRLSHAGGARPRPAPAAPTPPLSSDRKTDKKGSQPVVPCMFRVCHVWSRTGRGWRAGLEAGGGGARGGPLRRLRAPVPGRRRRVTKW